MKPLLLCTLLLASCASRPVHAPSLANVKASVSSAKESVNTAQQGVQQSDQNVTSSATDASRIDAKDEVVLKYFPAQ